jgi:hypothetical protein
VEEADEIERRALEGFSEESPWAPRSSSSAPEAPASAWAPPRTASFAPAVRSSAWNGDATGGAPVATLGAGMQRPNERVAGDPLQKLLRREEEEKRETPGLGAAAPQRQAGNPYSTRRSRF